MAGNEIIAPDGKPRCQWCVGTPEYIAYHDNEWGFPVVNDQRLFEKICLESFQSGLSWRTILAKRDNFREAFAQFDFNELALFDCNDVERLLLNAGIVRHRGKIEAVINNAKRAQELAQQHGSLAKFFWQFAPSLRQQNTPQAVSTSVESIALSNALKKLGWKFVGPTTIYAFMQAMGLLNDHSFGCITREKVEQARRTFKLP